MVFQIHVEIFIFKENKNTIIIGMHLNNTKIKVSADSPEESPQANSLLAHIHFIGASYILPPAVGITENSASVSCDVRALLHSASLLQDQ